MKTTPSQKNIGKISQIIGPVVDIVFDKESLPRIYDAVEILKNDTETITAEVEQLLSETEVRTVAMSSTQGIKRGMEVHSTGKPISVPVGEKSLGRIFNVLGKTVDNLGEITADEYWPIHRDAPKLIDQESSSNMLETGIKVIDLIAPFARGGKVAAFGGLAWVKRSS